MKIFSSDAVLPALLVVSLFAGLACCNEPYDPYRVRPEAMAQGTSYEFENNTVRYTSPDMVLEATHLSDARLDTYFSMFKGGAYVNPVPPGPYVVFSLVILNNSEKTVSYNPRMTLLVVGKLIPNPARDYTSFYTDLELVGLEDVEERMAAYKAAAFDTSVDIGPGEMAQGLLIFKKPKNFKSSARLAVENIYTGGKTGKVVLPFEGCLGE